MLLLKENFNEDATEHAPFFRIRPVDGVREYYINKDHNFFKKIWMNPRCDDFMKESLKLLISAIGESSLGAADDGKRWYFTEMTEWSRHLHITADTFVEKFNLDNEKDDNFDDDLPN